MARDTTIDALNRLLAIHCRSLPMYLTEARPWVSSGDERAVEVFEHTVADQKAMAQRVSRAILEAGGTPDEGNFPMRFTDTHDLSLDYLIREAIAYQKADREALRTCAEALRLAPAARALAEESIGLATGHLESFEELAADPVS